MAYNFIQNKQNDTKFKVLKDCMIKYIHAKFQPFVSTKSAANQNQSKALNILKWLFFVLFVLPRLNQCVVSCFDRVKEAPIWSV